MMGVMGIYKYEYGYHGSLFERPIGISVQDILCDLVKAR